MEKYTELHELLESAVIGLSKEIQCEDMQNYSNMRKIMWQ